MINLRQTGAFCYIKKNSLLNTHRFIIVAIVRDFSKIRKYYEIGKSKVVIYSWPHLKEQNEHTQ